MSGSSPSGSMLSESTPSGSTRPAWRHVRTIGRTELRRRWRALRDNTGQLVAIAISVLFFLPLSLGGLAGAYLFGRAIVTGDVGTPVRWLRLGLVYAWLLVVVFAGFRAYASLLRPDQLDGLLTTVSHRELLGGLLYAETATWALPIGSYGLVVTAVFAWATRSAAVLLVVPLTVAATLATGIAVGVSLALLVRNLGVRSRLLARLRTLLVAIVAIAYVGVLVTQSLATVAEPLLLVLEPSPVGWLGDLALLGTADGASALRAAGAVGSGVAVLLAGAVALPRLAELLWYADGVHVEREVDLQRSSTADSPLAGVLPRPTLAVVDVDWTRARRAPVTKSYVLYPLLVLIGPVTNAVETGTIGGSLVAWTVVVGAWITGAAFSLNVLGNEGAVLPATLLGEDPGRALVGGHVAAGALLGVPITVAATVALGLLSPLSAATTATLALAGLVLAAAAGPLATGVGAVFPRFEAVSVSRSTRAVVPSILAFAVYSVALFLLAAPALLGHSEIVGDALADATGVPATVVAATGTAATALLAIGFGVASAYYAVGKVERYTVE